MWSFMWGDNAIFFKTCIIFSEVNVNMAVQKLLIPLVYLRPFTTAVLLPYLHYGIIPVDLHVVKYIFSNAIYNPKSKCVIKEEDRSLIYKINNSAF